CENPEIFAYEPSPRVFDLLRANCAAYGDPSRVHAFNCGVAERTGSAPFTFYEHSSVFSSFHPDEREDRAAVEAVARNVLQQALPGPVSETDIADLTAGRLRAETLECPLTTVSDIIRENGISRIHLLKIDAEKSEAGILRGIADEHWPLIEQLVIEVHDPSRSAVKSIEELLIRRGFRCAVVEEKLLEQSGLFNVYATRRSADAARTSDANDGLQRKVGEFCAALDTFAAAAPNPLILAIAPRLPGVAAAALAAAEQQILARAAHHLQIRVVGSDQILARHPVSELHDAHSRQLGHMPFTQEGYAAIGTALFRAIFSLSVPSVKVIVLDCDNTLWQGLCAEDGPAGVVVTPAFRRLQEFMIEQMHAGVLLALCSKNQEADVMAVFEQHADMPLRREHLAGWRINWEPKPDNLRALAAQLDLGLDSFVFIDDNPVECAAVLAGCPEVITLQLPSDNDRSPAFLESLWIFDRAAATREDRERSQWYQANSEREEFRAAAPTLRDFLDGLHLQIEVAEATDDQLVRVAQLTTRTNQFNLTSIRRSETEIRDLLKSGARCLVTSVSDRFGDYGLVGVILYTATADRYVADTLLLSCRALGKGVEHRMVAELASRALHDGKSIIELPYRRTDRNEPAREFIQSLSPLGTTLTSSNVTLALPAATGDNLRYEPDSKIAQMSSPIRDQSGSRSGFGRAKLSAALQCLGDELGSVEAVVAAIESSRLNAQTMPSSIGSETAETASALERSLAAIWKKALGRAHVGLSENFFEAGGTSLKAVLVVAMIRKELKMNVSIIHLFECPTIGLLAAKLDGSASAADDVSAAASDAESRGRQRRSKLIRRKVA
ncbi:MAG: FkbM family methyltransferase, partial [Chthoniobacterales bacterium]